MEVISTSLTDNVNIKQFNNFFSQFFTAIPMFNYATSAWNGIQRSVWIYWIYGHRHGVVLNCIGSDRMDQMDELYRRFTGW